jgi:endonuclease/exonuclease/phosphatase (EEP) superfamily protein YafD
MKFKTLQWNIGGGKIKDKNNPEIEKYNVEGLQYIIDEIAKHNPDIITLQETHQSEHYNQAEIIANELDYQYFINDIYDKSHIEKGQGLGQAIISKFPISDHTFNFFENPNLEVTTPEGEKWISHDKGVSKVLIQIDSNKNLEVATLHLVPFKRFKVDILSDTFVALRSNIQNHISPIGVKYLLQGDFNFDSESLVGLIELSKLDVKEILQTKPTTPKNRKYDHVVYKGLECASSETISYVLTDHYPIISTFEI